MEALLIIALYFLPWILAGVRNHHNRGAIALTNITLGWTGLGWLIALIWASTQVKP